MLLLIDCIFIIILPHIVIILGLYLHLFHLCTVWGRQLFAGYLYIKFCVSDGL